MVDFKPPLDEIDDEELLEFYNLLPRELGATLSALEKVDAEVEARELFDPVVLLGPEEQTDDWLAERRNEIRLEISELARKEEALKAERDEIDQIFIERFRERQTSGTRAGRFTVSMRMDDNYPEVTDRTVFEEYVLKSGKLHLLQKRLSLSSVKEELAAFVQEHAAAVKALEEANFSKEACAKVLQDIQDESWTEEQRESLAENKLNVLLTTGRLKEAVLSELDEYYKIPGVNVVSKLTINQVRRN
jgi:hypothetical protein